MAINALTSSGALAFQTGLSKRLLSQSSNLGYFARGAYRNMSSTPEERKADYWFRDFMMIMAMSIYTELGFRAAEYLYGHPQFTKILGLHRLAYDYSQQSPGVKIKNYKSIADVPPLRKRIYGTMVNGSGNDLIPFLLEHQDKMGQNKLGMAGQSKFLIRHLSSRLDFNRYLTTIAKEDPKHQADVEATRSLLETYHQHFAQTEPFLKFEQQFKASLLKGNAPERLPDWVKSFSTLLAQHADSAKNIPLHAFHQQWAKNPEVATLFLEGIQSKLSGLLIKEVQRALLAPQITMNFLATLLCFGVIGNQFDFKILQPWEKKITQQGYSSAVIVKPSLASILPTCAILFGAPLLPMVKRMGYFWGFAVTSLAAITTFFGSTFLLTRLRLKKPPSAPQPPQQDYFKN